MTPAMKALSDQINQGDEHDNSRLLEAIEELQEREAEQARKDEALRGWIEYKSDQAKAGLDGDYHDERE